MNAVSEKILLVDDEPNVLRACERLLRDKFKTDAATGASEALNAIQTKGPYALVLSDMQMPLMDGLQLLTKVKHLAPDTVRIMLTGHADVQTALTAVNEGNIFRILTKPCSKQVLVTAISAGLEQYRLITVEKDLLEKTLAASLKVLTELLSVACPAALGRALRLRRYMGHIAKRLSLPNRWKFELAAMLSQLGCVTLVPDTMESVYAGRQLAPLEQAKYDAHPRIAWDLLKDIPRLESIAWMIGHQNEAAIPDGDISNLELSEMRMGAQLLQVTLDFDIYIRGGSSRTEAAYAVGRRHSDIDPRVMMALVELEPEDKQKDVITCHIDDITPGMVINQDIRAEGTLIVARNQEVTPLVILKLKNYHDQGKISGRIEVSRAMTDPPLKA